MTSLNREGIRKKPAALVVSAVAAVSILHFLTPAGPHSWRWLHVLYEKLYYVPLLVAAAFLGVRATLLTALAVSIVFAAHVLRDWRGVPLLHADQFGEIVSAWVIAVTASFLFRRERRALARESLAHEETLGALVSSLDLREHETALHSRRVREYTLLLAERMGIRDQAALLNMKLGALLHDVGKIGIPDDVLRKPSGLSEDEASTVRRHPVLGASLIEGMEFLGGARQIVRSHHERFDGRGYPDGLSNGRIPLAARIFAVADVLDALTADRPYRAALSFAEAAAVIAAGSGTQFDPEVVNAFLAVPFSDWAAIAARNGMTLR